jgi:hypothetical protein
MVSLCLQAKRPRVGAAPRAVANQMGAFEVLPQELILSVLTALSSAADKPADLFNVMLVYVHSPADPMHPSLFFLVCSLILLEEGTQHDMDEPMHAWSN